MTENLIEMPKSDLVDEVLEGDKKISLDDLADAIGRPIKDYFGMYQNIEIPYSRKKYILFGEKTEVRKYHKIRNNQVIVEFSLSSNGEVSQIIPYGHNFYLNHSLVLVAGMIAEDHQLDGVSCSGGGWKTGEHHFYFLRRRGIDPLHCNIEDLTKLINRISTAHDRLTTIIEAEDKLSESEAKSRSYRLYQYAPKP